MPKSIFLPKLTQNFTLYQINPQTDCQSPEYFTKVAKFRQFWSHCPQAPQKSFRCFYPDALSHFKFWKIFLSLINVCGEISVQTITQLVRFRDTFERAISDCDFCFLLLRKTILKPVSISWANLWVDNYDWM